jgi:hypothetical protein
VIKIPPGTHEDSPQDEISFVELMGAKASMLQPPPTADRGEVGKKIDTLMAALARLVEAYRHAVEEEHGRHGSEARVSLAVKNAARRAGLASVFGLG